MIEGDPMDIILIDGNVEFTITLDPSVWIFDDRKIEWDTFVSKQNAKTAEESYEEKMSKQWDEVTQYGVRIPSSANSEKKFLKEKLIEGTFVMPLAPFIENAKPHDNATSLIVHTKHGTAHVLPLDKAKEAALCFCIKGKPITDNGPAHLYYGDHSNINDPITGIQKLTVK